MTAIPAEVIKAAQASDAATHIPASVTIAQAILESGWFQHVPEGSNNYFGIKAVPGQPSVDVATHEVINGQRVPMTCKFAAYPSLTDAFTAHAKLLATGAYMAKARACLPDVHAMCIALGGGTPQHPAYSTDPNYGQTLWSIITSHQLTGYDT